MFLVMVIKVKFRSGIVIQKSLNIAITMRSYDQCLAIERTWASSSIITDSIAKHVLCSTIAWNTS